MLEFHCHVRLANKLLLRSFRQFFNLESTFPLASSSAKGVDGLLSLSFIDVSLENKSPVTFEPEIVASTKSLKFQYDGFVISLQNFVVDGHDDMLLWLVWAVT